MNNIIDVYAPFESSKSRDECLKLFLKIMHKPCVKAKPNVVWKRPLKKVFGPINDQDLREAIRNAGFKENHMQFTSLGKVITEVLMGNQRGWEPSGYRRPDEIYLREYKRMLANSSLIKGVTFLRELLEQQNVYFSIVDDLLGLSHTWRYEHFRAFTNFGGKLGHREKFLSLLHAGPTSMAVAASNRIENVAKHVFQLQSLGYEIKTTFDTNSDVLLELTRVPVVYVESDVNEFSCWGNAHD
jgi:hypothetical protein